MTARVYDECPRHQHCFNLLKQEELLLATRNQARRGRAQKKGCAFHLPNRRRDTCLARGTPDPNERSPRHLGPHAPEGDPRDDQFDGGRTRARTLDPLIKRRMFINVIKGHSDILRFRRRLGIHPCRNER
jgi:hypothetical protein